jgi:hypothetical protein
MTTLVITGLFHDLGKKRSHVTVVWEDDPEKRLGLPVPFGCTLEQLSSETEKAIRAFSKELESATIKGD